MKYLFLGHLNNVIRLYPGFNIWNCKMSFNFCVKINFKRTIVVSGSNNGEVALTILIFPRINAQQFFLKNVYLFLRERERQSKGEWGRSRERETENLKWALTADSPMWGSNSWTMRSWPKTKLEAWRTEPPMCPSHTAVLNNENSSKKNSQEKLKNILLADNKTTIYQNLWEQLKKCLEEMHYFKLFILDLRKVTKSII